MIEVRSHDGETEILLTRVDQFSDAESAARKLFDSVYAASKRHGGTAVLDEPEDRGNDGWAVTWGSGPKQWNHAYVVSEGADALGFAAEAEGEFTVVFRETD